MTKVRVIARPVARRGKEDQRKKLFQGMLAPTRRRGGFRRSTDRDRSRAAAHLSPNFVSKPWPSLNEPFSIPLCSNDFNDSAGAWITSTNSSE